MDKATPTPSPATVDSVMALAMKFGRSCHADGESKEMMRGDENRDDLAALRAEVERLAAQAAPPVKWQNGCDHTAPAALRFLAEHERPAGGQQDYNSEHLYQIADELEATYRAAQSPAQAPVVQAAQATEKSNWWCAHCGVFVMPVEVTFTERHDPEAGGCGFSVSASSGAAQAVRMLTQEELEHCRLWYDGALNQQLGVLRKFCEVNAGRTIPADGKIGSAA